MEILHIAVPAAIILVAFAILVFWWAVKKGQFDDLERQGMSILLDETPKKNATTAPQTEAKQAAPKDTDEQP